MFAHRSGNRLHATLSATFVLALCACSGCIAFPSGSCPNTIVPDAHSYYEGEASDGMIVSQSDPSLLPDSTCEGDAPERCTECASETSGHALDLHSIGASAISMCAIPMGAVGHVANFGIPPAGFSPAAVPPPGRFHPLPTRPVFSRR